MKAIGGGSSVTTLPEDTAVANVGGSAAVLASFAGFYLVAAFSSVSISRRCFVRISDEFTATVFVPIQVS